MSMTKLLPTFAVMGGWLESGTSINGIREPGVWSVSGSCTGMPTNVNATLVVLVPSSDRVVQFFVANSDGKTYVRHCVNGSWGDWVALN